jgi:hypothetical protein
MSALNVYVSDEAGRDYRVCFVEPALGDRSPAFIVRSLYNGESLPLDPKAAKGRKLIALARAQVKTFNVYRGRPHLPPELVWSGFAKDNLDALKQARARTGHKVSDVALFTRVAGDDPYEAAS